MLSVLMNLLKYAQFLSIKEGLVYPEEVLLMLV